MSTKFPITTIIGGAMGLLGTGAAAAGLIGLHKVNKKVNELTGKDLVTPETVEKAAEKIVEEATK